LAVRLVKQPAGDVHDACGIDREHVAIERELTDRAECEAVDYSRDSFGLVPVPELAGACDGRLPERGVGVDARHAQLCLSARCVATAMLVRSRLWRMTRQYDSGSAATKRPAPRIAGGTRIGRCPSASRRPSG
jgi:hypothetical protein